MKCRHVKKLLMPYLEEMLPAGRRSEVSDHLSWCRSCRGELEELEGIGQLLRANRDRLRPSSYGLTVAETVTAGAFAKMDRSPLPLAWRLVRQPVVLGLTALGVAIFSYLIGYVTRPTFDNNDIQFYLESYNQVSGVEIIAFGEPEER
ncbi:anti-sigma factor family protein [candidate division KSB1 bacterium]